MEEILIRLFNDILVRPARTKDSYWLTLGIVMRTVVTCIEINFNS